MSCKPCTNRSSIERMSFENRPMRTSWKTHLSTRGFDQVTRGRPSFLPAALLGGGPVPAWAHTIYAQTAPHGKQTLDPDLCSWGADARRAPMSHPSVGKVLNTSALGPTPYFFTGVRLRRFLLVVGVSPRLV